MSLTAVEATTTSASPLAGFPAICTSRTARLGSVLAVPGRDPRGGYKDPPGGYPRGDISVAVTTGGRIGHGVPLHPGGGKRRGRPAARGRDHGRPRQVRGRPA